MGKKMWDAPSLAYTLVFILCLVTIGYILTRRRKTVDGFQAEYATYRALTGLQVAPMDPMADPSYLGDACAPVV